MTKSIILASSSPRRKRLLEQIGLSFEIVPSNVEEVINLQLSLREQAESLALQKAQAVAAKVEEGIVLGADTLVALGNEIIGKPKDSQDAKRILKKLRGRQHIVVTGFVLIDKENNRTIIKSVETKVWFRKFSSEEIEAYVARENLMDKSGAYAITGLAAIFIEKIEGDFYNVVGLPLFTLAKELKKLGIDVL
ncbi:MAG TPA: Maf family protein [Patescibacteria group bacterium]|nr:Maf family protein [Patescibacteria group bacterium]